MVHVTIEYMILIPVLIAQIFIFPLAVGWIMNTWVDSRRGIEIQEIAGHVGSSMQQVYFSLNHTSIMAGTLNSELDIPLFIEGYPYRGEATIRTVLDPFLNSSKVLDINFKILGMAITTNTTVTLGQNVEWIDSSFMSNSTEACITAQKFENGTILMQFGTS